MCLAFSGVVTEIGDDDGVPMALVEVGPGAPLTACLLTCPQARVGDSVLVHSGYVLRIVDVQEVTS